MNKSVVVRDYSPSDYDDILDISKHIWDGMDYLPDYIRKYHSNPKSYPMVIEVDGKVVSVGNGRMLNDDIMWLEALRTHVDYRKQGFGGRLTEALIEKLEQISGKEAWLETADENIATRKLLKKMGVVEATQFNRIRIEFADNEFVNQLEEIVDKVAKTNDSWKIAESVEEVLEITKQIQYNTSEPYILGEFKVFPIRSEEFEKKLNSKKIYISHELQAIALFYQSDEHDEFISFNLICAHDNNTFLHSLQYFLEIIDREKYTHCTVFVSHNIAIPEMFDDIKAFRLMVKTI